MRQGRGRVKAVGVSVVAVVALCLTAAPASATTTIAPVKGQRWSGVVGSGHQGCPIDPDLPTPNTHNCDLLGPESNMTASITWGDGTAADTTATVSRNCAHSTDTTCTVLISGSHTYANAGTFNGSFTWHDPDPDYPASGSGTFTANVAATAPPVLETIDFDDLAPGTAVGTAYDGEGVRFGTKPGGAAAGNPVVSGAYGRYADGSDPNSAQVAGAVDPEIWAAFATPQAKVYAKAGDPMATGTVTLTGYDSAGHQVGADQETVQSGSASTALKLELASATISFVRISEAQPTGKLAIDDLAFYVPGAGDYSVNPYDNISATTCCTDATGTSYDGNYSGPVARIYKSDSVPDAASDYSATIRWGDGSTSTGTIAPPTAPGAAYDVTGAHHFQPVDRPTGYRVVVHVVKKRDPAPDLARTTRDNAYVSPPPPAPSGPTAKFDMTEPTGAGARPDQTPLHFDASQSIGSTCTAPGGCAPPSFPMKEYRWTIHLTSYNPANPDPTLVVSCPGNEPTMTAVFTDPRTWRVDLQVTNSDDKSDAVSHTFDIEPNQSPNRFHYNRVLALCGTHYGDLPDISDFSPSYAKTPQALQPGTLVTIRGAGFKPGTKVWFGGKVAEVDPESLTADTITARVPPLATTAPITLVVDEGDPQHPLVVDSASTLFVDDYRDVNGYRFHNQGPSDITFDQLTRAFGADQTYDSVNPCWPWGDCSASWRDPAAMMFDYIANRILGGKGSCYGISLTSRLFMTGGLSLAAFPHTGGLDVNHLDGRAAPAAPLLELLNAAQVQQLSYEFLTEYATRAAGQLVAGGASTSRSVRDQVESALRSGDYPLITLRDGGEGHVVVAYNVTDDPDQPGSYFIWVYDSNAPANGAIDESYKTSASRIHVDSSGHWALPSTHGMSGGESAILVWPLSSLPAHPTMAKALDLAAPAIIVFGSGGAEQTTQLADGSGHTLYGPGGGLNTDSRTRLDAMPFAPLGAGGGATSDVFVLPHGASGLKQTVVGTGSGSQSYTMVHRGLMAQVSAHTGRGVASELDLDPGAGSIGFKTAAAHAPVTLTLLGDAGAGRRTASVTTTGYHGAGDTLSFGHGQRTLSFVHHGPAADVSLTLSSSAPGGLPGTFQSAPVHVGTGQAVRVRRVDWGHLATGRLKVVVGGHGRTLSNRVRAPRAAAITRLHARRLAGRGHRVSLSIGARIAHVPAGSQVALGWVVRSGRHVVRTHALSLPARRGKLLRSWTFAAPRPGPYTLVANVVVLTGKGPTQTSSRATRSLAIHAP